MPELPRSALSPMSQTQMEPVVTEQQSTCQMNLTAAARNATLDSDRKRSALKLLRPCVNNVQQASTWRALTILQPASPVTNANQTKVCSLAKSAPLPQNPSVCASLGCTASWDLMTRTAQSVTSTRHAKLVLACLSQGRQTQM